jgi:hypothetical protein
MGQSSWSFPFVRDAEGQAVADEINRALEWSERMARQDDTGKMARYGGQEGPARDVFINNDRLVRDHRAICGWLHAVRPDKKFDCEVLANGNSDEGETVQYTVRLRARV